MPTCFIGWHSLLLERVLGFVADRDNLFTAGDIDRVWHLKYGNNAHWIYLLVPVFVQQRDLFYLKPIAYTPWTGHVEPRRTRCFPEETKDENYLFHHTPRIWLFHRRSMDSIRWHSAVRDDCPSLIILSRLMSRHCHKNDRCLTFPNQTHSILIERSFFVFVYRKLHALIQRLSPKLNSSNDRTDWALFSSLVRLTILTTKTNRRRSYSFAVVRSLVYRNHFVQCVLQSDT